MLRLNDLWILTWCRSAAFNREAKAGRRDQGRPIRSTNADLLRQRAAGMSGSHRDDIANRAGFFRSRANSISWLRMLVRSLSGRVNCIWSHTNT